MLQCAEGPARVHRAFPLLMRQQARSLLEGFLRLDSSAVGVPLSLEMYRWSTLKNDRYGIWKYVMFESKVAYLQFHNEHLVFCRKEVVCILSVVMRILLKPSSVLSLSM